MLKASIPETVELFRELKKSERYKIYALTNWQVGLFDIALVRYNFLHWFDGRVVSGEEKTRKPFPEFYQRLLNRYNVKPEEAIFIDDNLRNVKAAETLGITSIHFQSPSQLKEEIKRYNLL
jgi:2-haloacid dehalogenase